jgi:hypothetical protein
MVEAAFEKALSKFYSYNETYPEQIVFYRRHSFKESKF